MPRFRLHPLLALILLATTMEGQPAPTGRTGGARAGIDVRHYRFHLTFPRTAARDTIEFIATTTALRTGDVPALSLDLVAMMQVDSVFVNARRAPFTRPGDSVRVALPAGTGDTVRVAVHYHGVPSDGLVIRRDTSGGWTAFGDNFPDRARQWLAVVDHPADKALVTWEVVAPLGHRVVANGTRLEESPLDGSDRPMVLTRWETRSPIYPSVMVIGVAPFAVLAVGDSTCAAGDAPACVPQSVWMLPAHRAAMPGTFARAGEMVAYFASVVAPFPYEQLAHVASSTRYGGMENPTAIFYPAEAFARGGPNESTVAHEIAHQWFGDAVTERTWPDVWLSEGFATYFAALWMGHAHGESAFAAARRDMRERVLRSPATTAVPIVNDRLADLGEVLNTNVYQKAGFVLHLLRLEVGDTAFFGGIGAYFREHRHGNASSADVQRAMETAAGRPLGWFFAQWFQRPGLPELRASWRWDPARRRVVVTVAQPGSAAPYRLSLAVTVTDQSGNVSQQRVQVEAVPVTTVVLPRLADRAPAAVVFDGDVSLLGRLLP